MLIEFAGIMVRYYIPDGLDKLAPDSSLIKCKKMSSWAALMKPFSKALERGRKKGKCPYLILPASPCSEFQKVLATKRKYQNCIEGWLWAAILGGFVYLL